MPDIASFGIDEYGQPSGVRARSRVGDIVFSPVGTPRAGTLVCDGSAVSRQTYKELFDFLGVSCGEGDGETTFNLPDLRDAWILCAGTEHEAGDNVAEGLPDIQGQLNTLSGTRAWLIRTAVGAFSKTDNTGTSGEDGSEVQSVADTNRTNSVFFHASNSNSIYGAQSHVTPASVAVLPCIVYE